MLKRSAYGGIVMSVLLVIPTMQPMEQARIKSIALQTNLSMLSHSRWFWPIALVTSMVVSSVGTYFVTSSILQKKHKEEMQQRNDIQKIAIEELVNLNARLVIKHDNLIKKLQIGGIRVTENKLAIGPAQFDTDPTGLLHEFFGLFDKIDFHLPKDWEKNKRLFEFFKLRTPLQPTILGTPIAADVPPVSRVEQEGEWVPLIGKTQVTFTDY